MKNVRKRFLSLIMAMMMVLSCVATASAANVADNSVDNDSIVLSSTDGDEGIMPLTTIHYLTDEISVGNNQNSISANFQMNSGDTLAIAIASSVRVKVTIMERLSGASNVTYIDSTNNAGKVFTLAKPSGNLLKYNIEKQGSGTFAFRLVAIS